MDARPDDGCKGKPSEEKPWLKYYPAGSSAAEFLTCSLYALLREVVRSWPDGRALRYCGSGLNYAELLKKTDACADAFAAQGVKSGDIVSFLSVTTPETVFALYGLNKIGAVSNFIDPRMDPARILDAVTRTRSAVLVALDSTWPKIERLLPQLGLRCLVVQSAADSLPPCGRLLSAAKTPRIGADPFAGTRILRWRAFMRRGKSAKAEETVFESGSAAVITYTGGTTGTPKGVMLTNEGMNAVAQSFGQAGADHKWGDRFLDIMPVFASYGVVCGIHMPVAVRFENILVPNFTQDRLGGLVRRFRPACMMAVPSFYERLMESPEMRGADLSFLHTTGCGGDTMNPDLEARFNRFLREHGARYPLCQGYGLSECTAAATCCFGNVYKDGSVGIPLLAVNAGIFDPKTGRELDFDTEGEICFCGSPVMKGYYGSSGETAAALVKHADGKLWLHSGDLGVIDRDGILYVRGRIKQIIVLFDGHKVYPVQIEQVVCRHSAVRNCAVIGIPDRRHAQGMVPLGIAVLRDPAVPKPEQQRIRREILSLCDSLLEERGRPADITFVGAMPPSSLGKTNYGLLKKQFAGFVPGENEVPAAGV